MGLDTPLVLSKLHHAGGSYHNYFEFESSVWVGSLTVRLAPAQYYANSILNIIVYALHINYPTMLYSKFLIIIYTCTCI